MTKPRPRQSSDTSTPLALLMEHERQSSLRMSKTKLAEAIGVGRQTYSRWISAPSSPQHTRPTYENLENIARVLNKPVDELVLLSGIGRPKLDSTLSPIQRQCVDLVKSLPDPYLDMLLPQLTALADRWRTAQNGASS